MAKLYPHIKPYKSGYLKVSDAHILYYEMCGNPNGRPVLYLHGGPGAGISPKDRQYFNPRKYNTILFDQRGSGKSKPFASTKNNTTWKLVEDINKLLAHVGIEKVFLFGGSWGSTLALVYAINYPEKVTGMLLRGVFLSVDQNFKEFFGGFSAKLFPDAWDRFLSFVPNRKNPVAYYIKQMNSKNKKVQDRYAREWSTYELTMLKLDMNQKTMNKYLKRLSYRSMAPLEAHYLSQRCFLPENYILKNIHKLKMPVVIVHGRYDAICTPESAWKLHKALPQSKLYFTISGHNPADGVMAEKLIEEMDKFSK
ncbi:MAG TPA: prolyl aminopeptidase [archaeon]|nr:prolyl aminopeptidase [archaeon]